MRRSTSLDMERLSDALTAERRACRIRSTSTVHDGVSVMLYGGNFRYGPRMDLG